MRWRSTLAGTAAAVVLLSGCSSTPVGRGASGSSAVGAASASGQTSAAPPTTAESTTAPATTVAPRARRSSHSTGSASSAPSRPAPSTTPAATRRAAPRTPPPIPARRYAGTTVALNPGHNGGNGAHSSEISRPVPAGFGTTRACDTTGTATGFGYAEHSFNWDVAQRVRAQLQAHGIRVILSRPDDSGVGPCIDRRAQITNAADAVVSIHADGTPDGSGHGFHVCEDSRQPAGAAVAAASHRLTVAVHDALVRGSGLVPSTYIGHDGYYPRADLAGLNLATNPATFLELGNMRNSGDAARQTSASGRARIAMAIATGILVWLGER